MKSVERVIKRARDLLVAGLPAELDLIDLEWSDYNLPDISSIDIEGTDGITAQYPAMLLYEEDPELIQYSGQAALRYLITVHIWDRCGADGILRMTEGLWRYRQASINVLRNHADEPGYWQDVHLRQLLSSPVFREAGTDTYVRAKGALLGFTVIEDY